MLHTEGSRTVFIFFTSGSTGPPKGVTHTGRTFGWIGASLAATSGIHRATDALKMLMAGADVTMLCSVLLKRGIDHIKVMENELRSWMEEHEYQSVEQLKGSMSQIHCPEPGAFERAQYMRALSTYKTG